jgi:hypothetical protein
MSGSQLEERLLVYLEYHPHVAWYARGDIDAHFATTYRLPTPKEARETDVRAETLQAAAELLTLGRDIIRLIDGAGPTVEIPRSATSEQESVPQVEAGEAPVKDAPKQRPEHRDEVGETHRAVPSTHCSFSGPIELEAGRLLESTVEVVQCPTCGSVSKAKVKGQSVVISPHPPRKSRPVRNVTRWMEQEMAWVLVQKKE